MDELDQSIQEEDEESANSENPYYLQPRSRSLALKSDMESPLEVNRVTSKQRQNKENELLAYQSHH